MKVAVIGTGYWGKNLVRVFYDLNVLKTVCDIDKKRLKEIKKLYPSLETTTNFSSVLADKEIKAVVIATPAVTHFKLAKEALLAEKDVFVEKPLALTLKEGKKLVEISEKKKLILMVGHLLLYHPAIVKLKEMIKKGKLGEIRYIFSNRLNFGKLRKEENVLWSFAPHDISIMIDFLGIPKRVMAIGKSYLQKNIPDITLSFLEFGGKKAGHIFVSWLNPFKEQKLSIVGSKAMAVFDDQSDKKLILYHHKVKWEKNKVPTALKGNGRVIKIPQKEPLAEEAKHFIFCVKNRKRPKTDGKEALNVLLVLDACQKSIDKDGKFIEIKKL